MYDVTRLIHLTADASTTTADHIRAAADATGARQVLVEPTLPGVRNGGDLLAHLRFASVDDWERGRAPFGAAVSGPAIAHVDGAEYGGAGPDAQGRRPGPAGTVYRSLLLSVDQAASAAEVDRFERALLRMPAHIPSMRAWRLSRVSVAQGEAAYTHVWEQEFADLDGLLGQYMNHPIHWAHVDGWFDPENPQCVVRDRVCHSFAAMRAPVI